MNRQKIVCAGSPGEDFLQRKLRFAGSMIRRRDFLCGILFHAWNHCTAPQFFTYTASLRGKYWLFLKNSTDIAYSIARLFLSSGYPGQVRGVFSKFPEKRNIQRCICLRGCMNKIKSYRLYIQKKSCFSPPPLPIS